MPVSALALAPPEDFIEDYRNAILRNDVDALVDTYNFPMTFHDGVRTVVLEDCEAAQKAFLMLRCYYEDVGMESLETRFVASHRVSQDFVLVDVVWRLRDGHGMTICDQRSTFALREGHSRAKIVAVFLHDDI